LIQYIQFARSYGQLEQQYRLSGQGQWFPNFL